MYIFKMCKIQYLYMHVLVGLKITIFTTRNSHITWDCSCKFIKKKFARLFSAIFFKNFNWQVIPS